MTSEAVMNEDIVDLQTRLAFQDSVIEELNQVVTNQQKQIDRLENMMAGLRSQFESMQNQQMMKLSDEPPPPHY
jgi:SlyX protein